MKKENKNLIKLSNRQKVAHNLVKQIENKELINRSKALKEANYSKSTAEHKSSEVVNSRECQEELSVLLGKMEDIRAKDITDMLSPKKRKKASYRDHVASLDTLTKNIQLIGGKATANESINISWDD